MTLNIVWEACAKQALHRSPIGGWIDAKRPFVGDNRRGCIRITSIAVIGLAPYETSVYVRLRVERVGHTVRNATVVLATIPATSLLTHVMSYSNGSNCGIIVACNDIDDDVFDVCTIVAMMPMTLRSTRIMSDSNETNDVIIVACTDIDDYVFDCDIGDNRIDARNGKCMGSYP